MVLPPPMEVLYDGAPNLRHGTVSMHPLEVHLRDLAKDEEKNEFEMTASLFGIGFAKEQKMRKKLIDRATLRINGCDLGHDLATGEIDTVEFEDMFEPTQKPVDLLADPVREYEEYAFGHQIRIDI